MSIRPKILTPEETRQRDEQERLMREAQEAKNLRRAQKLIPAIRRALHGNLSNAELFSQSHKIGLALREDIPDDAVRRAVTDALAGLEAKYPDLVPPSSTPTPETPPSNDAGSATKAEAPNASEGSKEGLDDETMSQIRAAALAEVLKHTKF